MMNVANGPNNKDTAHHIVLFVPDCASPEIISESSSKFSRSRVPRESCWALCKMLGMKQKSGVNVELKEG